MRVFEEEQEGRTASKEGRREAGRRGTTPARRKTSICNLELANRDKELILMLEEMSGPQQSEVARSLALKMGPFNFDLENNRTFTSWIKRIEEVVGEQENSMLETKKKHFLIYKLDVYLYEEQADSILSLQPSQLSFEMAKRKLEKLSGDKILL